MGADFSAPIEFFIFEHDVLGERHKPQSEPVEDCASCLFPRHFDKLNVRK
jgi:hypothetical protein